MKKWQSILKLLPLLQRITRNLQRKMIFLPQSSEDAPTEVEEQV